MEAYACLAQSICTVYIIAGQNVLLNTVVSSSNTKIDMTGANIKVKGKKKHKRSSGKHIQGFQAHISLLIFVVIFLFLFKLLESYFSIIYIAQTVTSLLNCIPILCLITKYIFGIFRSCFSKINPEI